MPDPRDGSHICQGCRTALNVDDRNCWKCGGTNIVATAVQPADKELKIHFPAGSPWANMIAPVAQADPNGMAAPEPETQMYRGYLLKWDSNARMYTAYRVDYQAYAGDKEDALAMVKDHIDRKTD